MSWAASEAAMEAARSGPVGEGDLDLGRALDDVKCRQDVALRVDDHPRAEVFGARRPLPRWATMTTSPARTAS